MPPTDDPIDHQPSKATVRGVSGGVIGLFVFLLVVGAGSLFLFVLPVCNYIRESHGRAESQNKLREIGVGLHAIWDRFDYKAPPSAGVFDGRDGTVFYHLLPYVGQEAVYRSGDRTAVIDAYVVSVDPTVTPGCALASFASNHAVFGSEPSRTIGRLAGKGVSFTVVATQRFAVTSGTPHPWADTTDFGTWISGTRTQLEVDQRPETASTDAAHAFDRGACQVLMGDGSVSGVAASKAAAFRWACDPDQRGPMPPGWW